MGLKKGGGKKDTIDFTTSFKVYGIRGTGAVRGVPHLGQKKILMRDRV